ncbi:MAG: N-acetylmuramoyl-L-alanine amidase [Chlamydiae bacterium]|nr:N-acetylmuramoyl-L-alanine amidase [Chlamydiota bacterium]
MKVRIPLFFIFAICSFLFFHFSLGNAQVVHSSNGLYLKEYIQSPSVSKPIIVLDPGHGGRDEGTKMHSFQEKRITLATALYTKRFLEEMGYRVILTRMKDVEISLRRRVELANKVNTMVFVSIHFNASKNKEAKGIEIFHYDCKDVERMKNSRKLANYILHHVIDQTEAASRGVKKGDFQVIRETRMPAVLFEGGFVTNFQECSNLRRKEYLQQIAKGLALGIDKYYKHMETDRPRRELNARPAA